MNAFAACNKHVHGSTKILFAVVYRLVNDFKKEIWKFLKHEEVNQNAKKESSTTFFIRTLVWL